MSCFIYEYEGREIHLVENKYNVGCLCCFPCNHEAEEHITSYHVKAMAWLGAAVALIRSGENIGNGESVYLPDDLPDWIIVEINRLIPDNESEVRLVSPQEIIERLAKENEQLRSDNEKIRQHCFTIGEMEKTFQETLNKFRQEKTGE